MGKLSHARIDSRLDALLQRAQRLRSEYEDSAASSEPSTERAWRGPPAAGDPWPRSASLDEGVDRARGEAGTSDTDIQRLIARAADYKADRELQALDDEIPLSPLPRIRDRPSLRWGERARRGEFLLLRGELEDDALLLITTSALTLPVERSCFDRPPQLKYSPSSWKW